MESRVLAALAAIVVVACAPMRAAPTLASADHFVSLEHEWARAIVQFDSAALERLVAPEFVLAFADADDEPPLSREPWFRSALDRSRTSAVELRNINARVHGDSADVRLRLAWRLVGPDGQQLFLNYFLLSDTWRRRDGRWQVVRRTRLGEAPAWPFSPQYMRPQSATAGPPNDR